MPFLLQVDVISKQADATFFELHRYGLVFTLLGLMVTGLIVALVVQDKRHKAALALQLETHKAALVERNADHANLQAHFLVEIKEKNARIDVQDKLIDGYVNDLRDFWRERSVQEQKSMEIIQALNLKMGQFDPTHAQIIGIIREQHGHMKEWLILRFPTP